MTDLSTIRSARDRSDLRRPRWFRTRRRGSDRRFVVATVVALGLVGTLVWIAFGSGIAAAAGPTPNITPPNITLPTITTITVPSITAPSITTPGTTTLTTPDTSTGATSATTTTLAGGSGSDGNTGSISIDLGNLTGSGNSKNQKPNQSIIIILLLTVLAIAPALMVMLTSFTRIVIVLSLTRNALGLTSIPPNQVVIGLALFLSLFVMAPTLTQINNDALQPLLNGKISYGKAYDAAQQPLRTFMLAQTRQSDLSLFTAAANEKPAPPDKVQMTALVPAFVLSELKTAFIIGFVIFIPFLIIDLIVSSTLMSMGMFMLPPVLVSLPFKLLLFVMVDGWALIVSSLITSFHH
ncbi:MAG: flagellar type III secretion system pore protein FliP [Acidimicrobiia bacterium]